MSSSQEQTLVTKIPLELPISELLTLDPSFIAIKPDGVQVT